MWLYRPADGHVNSCTNCNRPMLGTLFSVNYSWVSTHTWLYECNFLFKLVNASLLDLHMSLPCLTYYCFSNCNHHCHIFFSAPNHKFHKVLFYPIKFSKKEETAFLDSAISYWTEYWQIVFLYSSQRMVNWVWALSQEPTNEELRKRKTKIYFWLYCNDWRLCLHSLEFVQLLYSVLVCHTPWRWVEKETFIKQKQCFVK